MVTDILLKVVIEELKQRVETASAKLKRYEAKAEQYVRNRMFLTNQAKIFGWKRMEKKNRKNDIRSGSQESVKFWNGKWVLPLRHNIAHWLKKVETQLTEAKKQENITKNLEKKPSNGEKRTGRFPD